MAYEGRYRETVRGFGESGGGERGGGDGQSLAETIKSLDGDIVAFRGCVQSIGTQFDDPQNRAELKRLRGVIKDKLINAQSELKDQRKVTNPQQKIVLDRQTRQLESHIKTYDDLLERERAGTKQNPLAGGATSPFDESMDRGAPSPSQSSQSAQALLGMGELETREAEAGELLDLERDIRDLHTIQTDIATFVQDQGEDIDRIEVRTEQAQARTEEGLKQTDKAVDLKKKNLKLKLIIAGVVTGVIVTLILIIVIVIAAVFGGGNN